MGRQKGKITRQGTAKKDKKKQKNNVGRLT